MHIADRGVFPAEPGSWSNEGPVSYSLLDRTRYGNKLLSTVSLLDDYQERIQGVLGCYDRLVIQGSIPTVCYAEGMTSYLYQQGIRIFDYSRFAQPLRDMVRANAERLAKQAGIAIEFIRKGKAIRKEAIARKRLPARGNKAGLVCILSAMESCQSFSPWHDKQTHKTFLKPAQGKCLHYYFYFMDPELGLCYLRVPTWCPFRLQFYFNGHNWLASKLRKKGIEYVMLDNAFVAVQDFEAAQALSDKFSVATLHRKLDRYARMRCPAAATFDVSYHWSIMQAEYSTDIVFCRQKELGLLYEPLVRTLVHAVKAEDVATFLGRKLTGNYLGEVGNDLSRRVQGTRIKHCMGPASIKMYDKCGLVLRIETTVNDVSFFKHQRNVVHRDGTRSFTLAPLRKTIYSLSPDLKRLMEACNRRYIAFLSELSAPAPALKALDKITTSIAVKGHTYRGFNFFLPDDRSLFEAVIRGEYNISGMRNRALRKHLSHFSPAQVCHRIKRLRVHGLLKKVGRSYKYYLTSLGRKVIATALRLRELLVLPSLASTAHSSA